MTSSDASVHSSHDHHDVDHRGNPIPPQHDLGLSYDLPTLLSRRRALTLAGGGLVALAAGCAADGTSTSSSTATSTATTDARPAPPSGGGGGPAAGDAGSVTTAEGEIPEETAGPYPGDGTNGPNVLTESGVVRSDITASFGGASGVAAGVPLTIELTILNLDGGTSAPLAGAAVYLWHCDQEGRYSLYSAGVTEENYLRGVQEAGSDGRLVFTSIYPAAYSGRWPHIHFEVYENLAAATSASAKLRTSQLALPEEPSLAVYATSGYEASVLNMARTSLDSDNVFSDGYSLQLATVTGSADSGYTATLTVPV